MPFFCGYFTSFERPTRHACGLRESHFTQQPRNALLVANQVCSPMINILDFHWPLTLCPPICNHGNLSCTLHIIPNSLCAFVLTLPSQSALRATASCTQQTPCNGVFLSSSSAGFRWFLQLIPVFQSIHF